MSKIDRLKDFHQWMEKIKNIHITNVTAMGRAYEIVIE